MEATQTVALHFQRVALEVDWTFFGGLAHSLSSGGNPFPFKGVLLWNFVALVLKPAEKCSLLLPQQ